MLRYTRCLAQQEVLDALRHCLRPGRPQSPTAPASASAPAPQPQPDGPPSRPSADRRRHGTVTDAAARALADRTFATELRNEFLRHSTKAWRMGVYTETRTMRRRMMALVEKRRREGVVGPLSYEVACLFFSQLEMVVRCERVIRTANADGVRTTPAMWEALLVCNAKAGAVPGALRVYRALMRARVPLSPKLVLPLLTALVKAGHSAAAFAAGATLLEALGPSADVYSQLLAACESSAQANLVLAEMKRRGVELSESHLTSAISAGYNACDVEHAMRVAQEARHTGGGTGSFLMPALTATFRRAGDVRGMHAMTSLALAQSEPTVVLFFQAMCSFVDYGDISSARTTFAVANTWKLAESLKIMSRATIAMGMRGHVKDVLKVFDARPLGKYTPVGLIFFKWALVSCLLRVHASPRWAFMRCMDDPSASTDYALHIVAFNCFRLRGFGVGAVWARMKRYMQGRRRGRGGNTPLSPGTHRYVAMAAALRVRDLVRAGAVREAAAVAAVPTDMFEYLTTHENPTVALMVVEPLIVVHMALGRMRSLLRLVRHMLSADLWPEALAQSLHVLRVAFTMEDDAASASALGSLSERVAAQRVLYVARGCGDFLRKERAVVRTGLATSVQLHEAAQARAMRNPDTVDAASIDQLLQMLPDARQVQTLDVDVHLDAASADIECDVA